MYVDTLNKNAVKAHCYALQCRRIDCEQIRSRINQQLVDIMTSGFYITHIIGCNDYTYYMQLQATIMRSMLATDCSHALEQVLQRGTSCKHSHAYVHQPMKFIQLVYHNYMQSSLVLMVTFLLGCLGVGPGLWWTVRGSLEWTQVKCKLEFPSL